ncbi:lactate 2-monooxygenase [Oleiharenicola lentus]|uniref:Lactate 2-monooxygenase n=1 Tax=Oleiharenicola lentus TaxID=2508720 RepID=A0A4Q1C9D2_9BACT|nr:lactate 2-monooxygenase [Oleiharenicola lentus]RXK55595.1 lactate 2-monooxygenase [Oleiharenicola lentus]
MSQPHSDIGRKRQREIYVAGVGGLSPVVPVAQAELEKAAQVGMSPEAWAYIAGGAGRESTMDANLAAFEKWRIVPRVLRDVEKRDLTVELFGRRLPAPLLLSPIGVLDMVHREADLAVGRAAASLDVPFIFSNQASFPMEQVAAAMGDAPRWFQLYWSRSNDLVASFVKRAEACGCDAIVLTLDTTMLGWRPRDLDLGSLPFIQGQGIAQYTSDPVFRKELKEHAPGSARSAPEIKPPLNLQTIATALEQKANFPGGLLKNLSSGEPRAAVQRFLTTYSRPSLQWDDLKFLRAHTKLPVLLKGVLHPDDARKAVELGLDGLIVSNHGGRQIDGAIASLDALPAVVEAVHGRIPVLFDSGVRGGADVFKALALGATAVCLGRPYVYGLALAGQRGVEEVIANVLAEFDLTLGLAGCTSVRGIGRESLLKI